MNAKVFTTDFTSTADKNLIVISENIFKCINLMELILVSLMLQVRADWTSSAC